MKTFFWCFLFFIVSFEKCESANILGVFPLPAKSVHILYQRLLKGLADAGHLVTYVSPYLFDLNISNGTIREIVLTGFAEEFEDMLNKTVYEIEGVETTSLFQNNIFMETVIGLYNRTYRHPNVRNFRKLKLKYDLLIIDNFWGESLLGFAKISKCPTVVFSSMGGVNPFVNAMVGNPLPPSYVPHAFLVGDFSRGLDFFGRFHNLLFYSYDVLFKYWYSFPAHNAVLKSNIRKNTPDVAELCRNVSLVLLGSQSSVLQAAPLVPNVKEIGGFHIDEPSELPADVKRFLDNSKNGAVYFSMGSVIQSKHFPDEKKRIFVEVFRKLGLRVLWKFEGESLQDKPQNVMIRKWLPQNDILAHPNVKLFITHGGYGSMLEAVHHAVPLLVIPIFYDQYINSYQAQRQGYALRLPYNDKDFTADNLFKLTRELLDNPKYARNAKARSVLFRDRPMGPLETAVYWVEYVIRHQGADHLRVAAVKMPLYQYYMLDVILFLVLVCGGTFLGVYFSLRRIFRKNPSAKKKVIKRN